MKLEGYLSQNKIDFILFHLEMNFSLSKDVKDRMIFIHSDEKSTDPGKIVFPLSESHFDSGQVRLRENLPVLFPVSHGDGFYHIENNSLVFHDDLFKSAFYLLSGYQELDPEYRDHWGRFPYALSVQRALNVCQQPLVNYYFEIIRNGINAFLKPEGASVQRTRHFNDFSFFLSHDVDRIDTYTFSEVGYRIKQAAGLVKSPLSRIRTIGVALKYLINYLNIFGRANPQWDFPYHIELEKKHGFSSTFYFLSRGLKHQDAYYSYADKRIRELFRILHDAHCEIGLHGTVKSSLEEQVLVENFNELQKHSGTTPRGIRQHRLLFDMNTTPRIHHNIGLAYDTSLGFAEHEGFRNSYCLPFRLFDHENDKMLDTWEIPLLVMDATLFQHRKLDPRSARNSMGKILQEVKKFNGVFSLLWHNGFFDELLYPGIRQFYEDLLQDIADSKAESLTGIEIIERVTSKSNIRNG